MYNWARSWLFCIFYVYISFHFCCFFYLHVNYFILAIFFLNLFSFLLLDKSCPFIVRHLPILGSIWTGITLITTIFCFINFVITTYKDPGILPRQPPIEG